MGKITFDDKVTMNENADIPAVNKGRAADWNEVKNVVNGNDDTVGDISNLSTTDKSSVVNAINENVTLLKNLIKTEDYEKTYSVNANTEATYQFDNIGLNGYNTLGIVYVDTDNNVDLLKYSVTGGTGYVRLKNIGNSTRSITCKIRVLYSKNFGN